VLAAGLSTVRSAPPNCRAEAMTSNVGQSLVMADCHCAPAVPAAAPAAAAAVQGQHIHVCGRISSAEPAQQHGTKQMAQINDTNECKRHEGSQRHCSMAAAPPVPALPHLAFAAAVGTNAAATAAPQLQRTALAPAACCAGADVLCRERGVGPGRQADLCCPREFS